jgi:hypothetical protein
MLPDSTRYAEDKNAAQQRFLSLFLRSEREIFRYVLDEFCLFNRALSGDEIRALYSVGKPQPKPLVQNRN